MFVSQVSTKVVSETDKLASRIARLKTGSRPGRGSSPRLSPIKSVISWVQPSRIICITGGAPVNTEANQSPAFKGTVFFGARTVAATTLACVLFLLPATIRAEPKTRVFNLAPADRVFEAAHKVARQHHTISYVDEKHLTLAFHTGTSMSSWGFDCNASVEAIEGGKARLTINVQKTKRQLFAWGGGDRTADNFFKWVEEELASEPGRKSPPNSDTKIDFGIVVASSNPESAEVQIDGKFVGNTPAKLNLTPGKHKIRVSLEGYQDWERDIEVLPNSTVNLTAVLKKRPS